MEVIVSLCGSLLSTRKFELHLEGSQVDVSCKYNIFRAQTLKIVVIDALRLFGILTSVIIVNNLLYFLCPCLLGISSRRNFEV